MKQIQIWEDNYSYYKQKLQLFENKIVIKRELNNGKIYEKEYSFSDFLGLKRLLHKPDALNWL